jgi:hypothetical protein
MNRRLPILLAVLFASLTVTFATASSASALWLGLQWTGDWAANKSPPEAEAIGRSGAALFRVPVGPPKAGPNNWGEYDEVFGEAAKRGVTILPQLYGRMNGQLGFPNQGESSPTGETWSTWARNVVCRYGYKGTFWSLHPELPYRPVIAWEMWNEPNNPSIEGGLYKSPQEYGNYLAWSGAAVQSGSESCGGQKTGVLFGALLNSEGYLSYLETAYKLSSGSLTGVAIHPYALYPASPSATTRLAAFKKAVENPRNKINELGGAGKSLWITESGWPVEPGIDEAQQAQLLESSVKWSKEQEAKLSLKAYIWYNYRNFPFADNWSYRSGLRTQAPAERFSQVTFRPSWYVFQAQAGAARWPVAPVAQTISATNVGPTEATLKGTINPHGLPTGYHFELAEGTQGFSKTIPAQDVEAGWKEGSISVSIDVTNLNSNTSYTFRVVGTNENYEITGGGNLSFVTRQGGPPSVDFTPDGLLHVGTRSASQSLLDVTRLANWAWKSPTTVGGTNSSLSPPASIVDSSGKMYFAAIGPNNSLSVSAREPNGTWTGPFQILGEGTTYSKPAMIFDSVGNLSIFAVGPNGKLYQTQRYSDATWHGPAEIGSAGTALSNPAVVRDASNNIFVYAEGPNNTLNEFQRYSDWSWHGPYQIGGPWTTLSPPTVIRDNSNNHFVYVKGPNNTLNEFQRYSDWSWHGPYQIGGTGTVFSQPAALRDSSGNHFVYAQGPNNTLDEFQRYSDWSWHGPYQIGGPGTTYSPPAAIRDSSGNHFIYVQGPTNNLNEFQRYGDWSWHGAYEVGSPGTVK